MKIVKIVNENNGQNNYLVMSGLDAVLIDGSARVKDIEENLKILNTKPTLKAVLLTHEHFDHIAQVDNLIARFGCPVYIHELGKDCLYKEDHNLSVMDTPFKIKEKKNIITFKDGDELTFGDINVKFYHTPGHSLGSSCFIIDDNMFVGDSVFKVDIGRNDLFGGDSHAQSISLKRIRDELSEGINHFYSGHGANFDKKDLEYNLNHFLGDN